MEQPTDNINQSIRTANAGLNMDSSAVQIKPGQYSYALNASVENFDANSLFLQNESGNELCVQFPEGFVLIGSHFINEQTKYIYFITSPSTGDSQIGYMENNDCTYRVLLDAPCLNFNIYHPIHTNNIVHKITNCTTELYWTDGYNPRRYLDINDIPRVLASGSPACDAIYTDEVDCNQLKVQPDFSIPSLSISGVTNTGDIPSGTVQFAIQYSDASSNPFTSYYSVTNPLPIADTQIASVNFNNPVGKSVILDVAHLDTTGQFEWFNIAVIKTVNAISSVELIGTYFIEGETKQITYTGQVVDNIRLSINDIFEKFPYYDISDGLTTAQDILIWNGLTSIDRINFQPIASQIELLWESWRIPATETYADELNATNLRSYLRDEVYPFGIVPLSASGKQYDEFHIPGRKQNLNEDRPDIPNTHEDFIGDTNEVSVPYWKIYNTAKVTETIAPVNFPITYKGAYQCGEFAYWESTEEYPCNTDVWGDLAGQKIRHHKFPDVLVSPIYETKIFTTPDDMVMGSDAVFPLGVRINVQQVQFLINTSTSLTASEKADIVGFKIVRGDRGTNKSIVGKGILRNVGSYTKDETTYLFPNYPYNDLREDPFINSNNNAYNDLCDGFAIDVTFLSVDGSGNNAAEINYVDCNTNKSITKRYTTVGPQDNVWSNQKPSFVLGGGTVTYISCDEWRVSCPAICGGWRVQYNSIRDGIKEEWINGGFSHDDYVIQVVVGTVPTCVEGCEDTGLCNGRVIIEFIGRHVLDNETAISETPLPGITDKYRQIFNSPETSFGQPFLGDVLKLESVMFGAGKAHFTEVKDNAKYKLITKEAQKQALDSSAALGGLTSEFSASAMFAAYQAYLQIYINGITRKNYAYSFNSIASYDYAKNIPNDAGIKQRTIDIAKYLPPSVLSISPGENDINNWNRETSVFLKTTEEKTALPFPDSSPEMLAGNTPIVTDYSRFTISEVGNCNSPSKEQTIRTVAYYASLKKTFVNQWGQIYSYNTIDTGCQVILNNSPAYVTVFGGDTFIGRFAFKTKVPFFIDNRVGAPDDSDIFYDEIGNIGYPKYWHSSRSILEDYSVPQGLSDDPPGILANIISYKAHNFDCPNNTSGVTTGTTTTSLLITTTTTSTTSLTGVVSDTGLETSNRTYYDGYFYLFAYGVPNFYCESSYNLDLRQAFNNREGDFWPHVTNSIPDDWVQESFVSIANDNTYHYNITYSKQNKENTFTHLPPNWEAKLCFTNYPFRAIYSDVQNTDSDNSVNAWLTYRAISYFDFPQNFGALISLDGIENRAILARFENKTLMYDKLLTMDTSNPQAAYVGNPKLFSNLPIDFADTDLGYAGSQHKFLLKIPEGAINVDAKRGQVFLLSGLKAVDLSGFGSGMQRFFTDHTAFEILRWFPNADIDNHFNGIGLHGVYDSKYDRVIITKLDYVPIDDRIQYDAETHEFYIEEEIITIIKECDLLGTAVQIDTCVLEGTAEEIAPLPTTTTTTTTIEIDTIKNGVLYNYYVTTDERNIISNDDWRVATGDLDWPGYEGDFGVLLKFLDSSTTTYYSSIAGVKLKEESLLYWFDVGNIATGTNETNFNGRGSGIRDGVTGIFSNIGSYVAYWARSLWEDDTNKTCAAISFLNVYQCPIVGKGSGELCIKTRGSSIRLIKTSTSLLDGESGTYSGNDGKVYRTICIGTQEWLADNLAETKFRNGELIPVVSNNSTWASLTSAGMCYYNNDINNA